jgi:hypothetical protein
MEGGRRCALSSPLILAEKLKSALHSRSDAGRIDGRAWRRRLIGEAVTFEDGRIVVSFVSAGQLTRQTPDDRCCFRGAVEVELEFRTVENGGYPG